MVLSIRHYKDISNFHIFRHSLFVWDRSLNEVHQFLCLKKWQRIKRNHCNSELWPAEQPKRSDAMRQEEKKEEQDRREEKREKRKQSPKWTRQYSDDVFIEDPLPTIKPRWGDILSHPFFTHPPPVVGHHIVCNMYLKSSQSSEMR